MNENIIKNIDMDELIRINGIKREAYDSPLIEPIKIVNEEEKRQKEMDGDNSPMMTSQDVKGLVQDSTPLTNEHGNIHKNNSSGIYYVPTGEKPRFTKDIQAIEEANKKLQEGTLLSITSGAIIAGLGAFAAKSSPYSLAAKAVIAATGAAIGSGVVIHNNKGLMEEIGYGLQNASVKIATAATAIGLVPTIPSKALSVGAKIIAGGLGLVASHITVEKSVDYINEGIQTGLEHWEYTDLKNDFDKEVVSKIKANENQIDLHNLFQDPYVNSLGPFIDYKTTDGKHFFNQELRNEIVNFESYKEHYSKIINTLIQTHDVYSKMDGKEKELLEVKQELIETINEVNKMKQLKVASISDKIFDLKTHLGVTKYKEIQNDLKDVLMDYKTFSKLQELNFLENHLITTSKNSKIEGINTVYGENNIDKIKGTTRMLELGISNGVLFKGLEYSEQQDLKKMIQSIEKSVTNFDNLSQSEKKEMFEKYKEFGTILNSFVRAGVEFIDPSKASLVAHIGKKDFINVKEIDNIVKDLGLDNIEIVQNEKNYEQEQKESIPQINSLADVSKL